MSYITEFHLPPWRNDPNKEYDPDSPVNPDPTHFTVCTGDLTNNIFFIPKAPGYPGRAILDEMTYDQVHNALLTLPAAKKDLLRITDDPTLIAMANETKLVVSEFTEGDNTQRKFMQGTLPYYTILRGNWDGHL